MWSDPQGRLLISEWNAGQVGRYDPADGSWLYFVVIRQDGTTAFASTHEEHCANVREGIRNGVDLNPNC